MGRVARRLAGIALLPVLLAAGITVSCESRLFSYLFEDLFYAGWKVASWSSPAPVVDGESHAPDVAKSNGFPMNLVMGSNGKLHLIAWKVDSSARDWVYTSLQPGEERFEQSFAIVADLSDNPGGIAVMPAIDLISDDVPYILYSHGSSPCVLTYQEYNNVTSTWGLEQELYSVAGNRITRTFVAFLTSDFRPHVFFVTDESPNKMYHTVKVLSLIHI